jgi:propanol-preferring alcohol dehydrogenase
MFKSDVQNKTIRGSITGNRIDLQEALEFAADGKVKPNFTTDSLKNINRIFDQIRAGTSVGYTVLQIA